MGHDFLRHIDRCRLLIHIVDVSAPRAGTRWRTLRPSTPSFRSTAPALASRKMLVAANKTDILADRTLLEQLKAHVEGLGLPLFELSAATHQGVRS